MPARRICVSHSGSVAIVDCPIAFGASISRLRATFRDHTRSDAPEPTSSEVAAEQIKLEQCRQQVEIDRKREELWELEMKTRMYRSERQRKLKPYSPKPDAPKVNGTDPLDLPTDPQPKSD